jgi:hypothetical protein
MNPPDPLPALLANWRHTPAPAPDFEAKVWGRIRAPADSAAVVRFAWSLPLAACVTVMLSVAAGTGSALALNQAQTAELMAKAYVRSVDPVQMASGAGHEHSPS